MSVLWYLADQAHLLQINLRNLRFLPPQGPGHHGPPPPHPPSPGPGFSPARARRAAARNTWDPFRFPEAEATDIITNPYNWQQQLRHTRETPDDAAPREATFQAFTGPSTLHKLEGQSATDIM